jgi:predicted amidohydrolase YtcJ
VVAQAWSTLPIWLRSGALFVLFGNLLLTGVLKSDDLSTSSPVPNTIYYNANIETMNSRMPVAQAVAIIGGRIVEVGSNRVVLAHKGPNTKTVDLRGATVLPGFIDAHSHFLGYAFLDDRKHWLDVSSTNMYFKPLPGTTPDCPAVGSDPQKCFVPVQTQDDVLARIQAALTAANSSSIPILAFNYDPSRLGHGSQCKPGGVGFQCPNFEDGTARETLDALKYKDPNNPNPILVVSESGHINYANTAALKLLNICGTDVAHEGCQPAIINPQQEEYLANLGQLNEDLSLSSTPYFEFPIIQGDNDAIMAALQDASSLYAQHGFTMIQEGAAIGQLITQFYEKITTQSDLPFPFPFTAAMYVFENNPDFNIVVTEAEQLRAAVKESHNPNLIIAAVKSIADGSTQGYTGYLSQPYFTWFFPFTNGMFFYQPYTGIADLSQTDIGSRAVLAHRARFPMAVHQNGDQAIADTLAGLQDAQKVLPTPNLRDVIVHDQMATPADLAKTKELNAPATFLIGDLYYYGVPMCEQILGRERTATLYPAADAIGAGLHVTLHSDAPVTPPDPLFMIWVAKTRSIQQMPWYPVSNPACAGSTLGTNEAISIAQGIKAFTTEAAWQYGLEQELGMIAPGFTADLVFLSADPLSMENNPDLLKTIRVLATVHHGQEFPNPKAKDAPIWPL